MRATEDGDFSRQRFEEVYQSELAHGIGNLVGRVIGLATKLGIGIDSEGIDPSLADRVSQAVDRFALEEATAEIWAEVDRTNGFLQEQAPWKLTKEEAEPVVRKAISSVRAVSSALSPFLPDTAKTIGDRLEQRAAGSPLFEDLRTRAKGP